MGSVRLIPPPGSPPEPLRLDYEALGKLLAVNGWNDMGGRAAKFTSQDGEYRVYQPTTAPLLDANGTLKGTTITTQLDNIRPGADDHCYATFEVDSDGMITSNLEFTWGNTREKAKTAAPVALWIASKVSDAAGLWGASKFFDMLAKGIDHSAKTSNPNGRVNFNAVVSHTMNKIFQCTRTD